MKSLSSRVGITLLIAGSALLLSACANTPNPEEVRDSLTEVTEDATPPNAADEFNIETSPEPTVDPLECTQYLAITVRGTGEPTKGQLLSPVARAISKARPDAVQIIDLDYPADTDVNEGGTRGVRTLLDTLNQQTEICPEQLFVVLGYSQGALIIGDALSAPDERLVGATVGELTEAASSRIVGVVLYGDPRFLGTAEYNYGSYDSDRNGLLPRKAGALDTYTDRLRDYCVAADFICQSSFDLDEKGHVSYFDNGMQQDGAAFVITRLSPPSDDPPVTPKED